MTQSTEGAANTEPAATAAGDAGGSQQPGTDNTASGGEAAGQATGAPETYADFTLPDGAALAPEVVNDVKAWAKAQNLSQEQAQRVADLLVQQGQASDAAAREASTKAQDTLVAEARAQWEAELKADKEIGGDKLPENLARAKQVLEKVGGEKLSMLLDRSGLGNHPEVVRMFVRLAPSFLEAKHVPADAAANRAASRAERFYGSTS